MKSTVRSRSGSPLAVSLLVASIVTAIAAAAADDAKASGKWTVDGKTVELRFARSFREPEPFGKGTSPCVVLSNEAVPDAAVPDDEAGISELLDLMRGGSMRALQVCFDASGAKLRNVNDVFTFHPDVSPGHFGLQGWHQFTAKPAAGRLAGKVTGSGTTMSDRPWSDEVDFSAPMPAE